MLPAHSSTLPAECPTWMTSLPCPAIPAASTARTASAGGLSMPDRSCPGWKESGACGRQRGEEARQCRVLGGQGQRPCVGGRAMQALSFHLGLQLPSAVSALAIPPPPPPPSVFSCPAPQCGPDYDLSCWPRTPLFSKGESLGSQSWHPSLQHFGLFKAHSGRWAEVCIFS